jgi:hypothetical protein
MIRAYVRWAVLGTVLVGAGCNRCGNDPDPPNNNNADAAVADAGGTDGGRADAGRQDAGGADAGGSDGGPADGGGTDGGSADGGGADGGVADGGGSDAGECLGNCVGRQCGDDGCGNSCGTCDTLAAPYCDELAGRCTATCTPVCAGRNCGDDGCGGTCGTCVGTLRCSSAGVCVPPTWTCDPVRYAARDRCDCGCGAVDPDCADSALATAGCTALERCASDGNCSPRAPAGWTCLASRYAARDACDCGCGVVDPDCMVQELPVRGCTGTRATCSASATCDCTPACGNNACGDNGCGGSCGTCANPQAPICLGGACVSACDPAPIRCNFAQCGSDACGGSCGTCTPGSNCVDGRCVQLAIDDPLTCFGRCGNFNPAGCSCSPECVAQGNCCPDYTTTCGNCLPACGNRACGPDGCGGACGVCGEGAVCSAGVCITGCQPDCDGRQCGDDGCGGQCGSCQAGESCEWTGQCVPDDWFCNTYEYGDGTACHCGCGAVDPNCASSSIVFGCGSSQSTCSAQGLCSDAPCASDAACGPGRICAGTYYRGDARFSGSCATSVGGREVGELCSFGGNCATGICAEGLCRQACGADGDCPSSQLCVAKPLTDLQGAIAGFMNVCEAFPGRFGTCAAQADCPSQACVAFLEPTSLLTRYTCSNSPRTVGTACDATACEPGQYCVAVTGAQVCTLACPGGNADCPIGWSCRQLTLSSASFTSAASAPAIPACLPN